jgi:hypothetical protein
MATVDQGLQSQVRNIEATYGRSIDEWIEIIRVSGLVRHGETVAMLKSGMVASRRRQPCSAESPSTRSNQTVGTDPEVSLHAVNGTRCCRSMRA